MIGVIAEFVWRLWVIVWVARGSGRSAGQSKRSAPSAAARTPRTVGQVGQRHAIAGLCHAISP